MPQKTFEFTRRAEANLTLALPGDLTPEQALDAVLRLPAVGSKRFLTTKVDRCVTGARLSCLEDYIWQTVAEFLRRNMHRGLCVAKPLRRARCALVHS